MDLQTIKYLAQEAQELTKYTATTEIYILQQETNKPMANSVKRIGGAPIGVTPATWPHFNGTPMQHVLTLDLAALPALHVGELANVRAAALFISHFEDNQAFRPQTPESAVILLSEDDIQQGEPNEILNQHHSEPQSYQVQPVTIPIGLFNHLGKTEKPGTLRELQDLLYTSSYAAGKPLWMQGNEHDGHFLCQFDETFIEMNLGDAGIMYIFTDTAFWQCG
jgi:hypothetical protein